MRTQRRLCTLAAAAVAADVNYVGWLCRIHRGIHLCGAQGLGLKEPFARVSFVDLAISRFVGHYKWTLTFLRAVALLNGPPNVWLAGAAATQQTSTTPLLYSAGLYSPRLILSAALPTRIAARLESARCRGKVPTQ